MRGHLIYPACDVSELTEIRQRYGEDAYRVITALYGSEAPLSALELAERSREPYGNARLAVSHLTAAGYVHPIGDATERRWGLVADDVQLRILQRESVTGVTPLAPGPHQPIAPIGEFNTRVIPFEVRAAVWARDKGRCRNCGSAADIEFDHVVPYSRGGAATVRNIQLLCHGCNIAKGATMPAWFVPGPAFLKHPLDGINGVAI